MTNPSPPVPLKLALTYVEAGHAAALCAKSIALAVARGELPACRVGRSVRILPDDLAAWLRSKRTGGTDAR